MKKMKRFLQTAIITTFLFTLTGTSTSVAADHEKPYVKESSELIVFEYRFGEPKIVTEGAFDGVAISGFKRHNKAGAPVIPVKHVQILVPAGKKIEKVTSEPIGTFQLPGTFKLAYGAEQFFKSEGPPDTPTQPDPKIFSMIRFWPVTQHELLTVQTGRGFNIAYVNLFPMQYSPRTGRIRMAAQIRLTVYLSAADRHHGVNPTKGFRKKILRNVDNPETLQSYIDFDPTLTGSTSVSDTGCRVSPLSNPENPYYGENYKYVVITSDTLANISNQFSFQGLCDAKISRGIPAGIVTTDWILANYDGTKPSGGSDNATKIRNFLIDAYQTWATEYALLGGNRDIIPPRLFYEAGYTVPADLYYGCVDPADCTFDYDADGHYAESNDGPGGGDVDLTAEIFTGRAAVEDAADVINFVRKTLAYESTNDPYLDVAGTMGGYLGFGDIQEFNKPFSELMRLGSNLYLGHFTAGFENPGIPNPRNFTVTTLYDEDYAPGSWNRIGHVNPPWDYYSDGWDATTELLPILNGASGHTTPQMIYIGDHGDTHWGMVKLCTTPTSLDMYDYIGNLTNTNYFFFFDDSCLVGAFDTADCFGEEITTMEHGAFACILNSREGLGAAGNNLDSVTTMFTREFFHSVLGEGIFELGRALQEARESCLWRLNSISWFRYQYYELTLFGDPELQLRAGGSGNPELSGGSVTPAVGYYGTRFEYTVDYYDAEGDVPSTITVNIDGTDYAMTLESGTESDGTYRKTTRDIVVGETHDYFFYAEDGQGGIARLPETGTLNGPTTFDPELYLTGTPAHGAWMTVEIWGAVNALWGAAWSKYNGPFYLPASGLTYDVGPGNLHICKKMGKEPLHLDEWGYGEEDFQLSSGVASGIKYIQGTTKLNAYWAKTNFDTFIMP